MTRRIPLLRGIACPAVAAALAAPAAHLVDGGLSPCSGTVTIGGESYPVQRVVLHPSWTDTWRGSAPATTMTTPAGRILPPSGWATLGAGRESSAAGVPLPDAARTFHSLHPSEAEP